MKMSLALNHSSGYVSYFDTGYWLNIFQYAGNRKMNRCWKPRLGGLPPFLRIWVFCLAGSCSPLLFLKEEVVTEVKLPTWYE
jgi:hypothetical protein